MDHWSESNRRDSGRNQLLGVAVQHHPDVRVSLQDLAVNEALQRGSRDAGVDWFCVQDAILADVVTMGDHSRRELVHHEEGCRVIRIPRREVAEAVDNAMEVENVQSIDIGGEELASVWCGHLVIGQSCYN